MTATSAFKANGDYDLQSELDRKVLDTIEKLDLRYSNGQITEAQLSESFQTLYNATFGLVSDKRLQKIMEAYTPTVQAPACYALRAVKGEKARIAYWAVDDSSVKIYDGDNKGLSLEIPAGTSPHDFYNAVVRKLSSNGWTISNEVENK